MFGVNKETSLLAEIICHIKNPSVSYKWDTRLTTELIYLCEQFELWGGLTKHFLKEFKSKDSFDERLGEMLFARKLKKTGINFKIYGDGPDFFLPDHNLWIELVCPKPCGLSEEYCSPIETGIVRSCAVPSDSILLRWTSVIENKIKGLSIYKDKKIVEDNHGYIIVVNCCQLGVDPTLDGQSGFPVLVEISYGIGPLTIAFHKNDPNKDEVFNPQRNHVKKPTNSAAVGTEILFNKDNSYVSAIMGTNAGLNQVLMQDQEKYVMAHNPLAINRVKYRFIEGCSEFDAKKTDSDDYRISLIDDI